MTVNGAVAELGTRADPERDEVRVDGELLPGAPAATTWLMLHKPARVVTSRSDEKGRETVMDLVGPEHSHVFPVGRLDMMTTGLLLLTDDGELAHRLLRPAREIEKVYRLTVDVELGKKETRTLCDGTLEIDGRPIAPARLRKVATRRWELILTEGRNRQVRRMIEAVGRTVEKLHRARFGPLALGDLPLGAFRPLTPEEVASLAEVAA